MDYEDRALLARVNALKKYLLPNSRKKTGKKKSSITYNEHDFTGTVAAEKGTIETIKTTKKNSAVNGPGHLLQNGA